MKPPFKQHPSERYRLLCRGLYALFDLDLIPGTSKDRIFKKFSEVLVEISGIALDIGVDPKNLDTLLDNFHKQKPDADKEIIKFIEHSLNSPEATIVFEYYFAQTIRLFLSILPEEKETEAVTTLETIGIEEGLLQSVERDFDKLTAGAGSTTSAH